MGIGGIADYSNLFASYKVAEIPSVNAPTQVKPVEKVAQSESPQANTPPAIQPQSPARDIDLNIEEAPRRQADVKELSLTFNTGEDFSFLGKDSHIEDLDIQKAISDMQKDSVLKQYQYFVGNAENLLEKSKSEDGTVLLKLQ